jgi:hypothetical protein
MKVIAGNSAGQTWFSHLATSAMLTNPNANWLVLRRARLAIKPAHMTSEKSKAS